MKFLVLFATLFFTAFTFGLDLNQLPPAFRSLVEDFLQANQAAALPGQDRNVWNHVRTPIGIKVKQNFASVEEFVRGLPATYFDKLRSALIEAMPSPTLKALMANAWQNLLTGNVTEAVSQFVQIFYSGKKVDWQNLLRNLPEETFELLNKAFDALYSIPELKSEMDHFLKECKEAIEKDSKLKKFLSDNKTVAQNIKPLKMLKSDAISVQSTVLNLTIFSAVALIMVF